MNLEDLRSVQSAERRADSLQSLREDFYRDVATYIEQLRAEREHAAERADDPFGSEEVRQLTDEIETAEEVAEAIYERRVGKVVKQASLAAAGMNVDQDGLTAEERDLFADLVATIEAHRADVLAAFAGDGKPDAHDGESDPSDAEPGSGSPAEHRDTGPHGETVGGEPRARTTDAPATTDPGDDDGRADPDPPGQPAPNPTATGPEHAPDVGDDSSAFDAVEAMGGDESREAGDESREGDAGDDARDDREVIPAETDGGAMTDATGQEATPGDEDVLERTTVRVTQEVGEIFGVDERTYHLGEEDVVSLPEENAEPLLERDAAQELEGVLKGGDCGE